MSVYLRAKLKPPTVSWEYFARRSAMKTIRANEFKEQCLTLLDELDAEGLVITKHGKPIARLIPYRSQSANLIGSLSHKIKVRGDISSTDLKWDAAT